MSESHSEQPMTDDAAREAARTVVRGRIARGDSDAVIMAALGERGIPGQEGLSIIAAVRAEVAKAKEDALKHKVTEGGKVAAGGALLLGIIGVTALIFFFCLGVGLAIARQLPEKAVGIGSTLSFVAACTIAGGFWKAVMKK